MLKKVVLGLIIVGVVLFGRSVIEILLDETCRRSHFLVTDYPSDNYSECDPVVLNSLNVLHATYGKFSITCRNGYLHKVFAKKNYGISLISPVKLVEEHPELFVSSASRSPIELKDMAQYFQGYRIRNRYVEKLEDVVPSKLFYKRGTRLLFSISDTSSWDFKPKLRYNCDQAKEEARRYDARRGIEVKGWSYSCDIPYPFIEADLNPTPSLFWSIKTARKSGNSPAIISRKEEKLVLRGLYVDANSGKITEFPRD